jgi:hypothetical protein
MIIDILLIIAVVIVMLGLMVLVGYVFAKGLKE